MISNNAVCACLAEEPIRGICTEYARESEYGILPYWDVSRLTNFIDIFDLNHLTGCSGVTEQSLSRFNPDFSYWNMEKAEDVSGMFRSLPKFEGKGLKFWDVSSATDMTRMFDGCDVFNEPIGLWDTSSVTQYRNGTWKMFMGERRGNLTLTFRNGTWKMLKIWGRCFSTPGNLTPTFRNGTWKRLQIWRRCLKTLRNQG